jgi:hypothetical protein
VTHCTDEDLTLYYYGEGRRRAAIARHLERCASCAALYREIADTLELIAAPDAPERDERYGLQVWHRLQEDSRFEGFARFKGFAGFVRFAGFGRFAGFRRFAGFERFVGFRNLSGLAAAAGLAVLVVAAFIAGHAWRTSDATSAQLSNASNPVNPSNPSKPANPSNLANPTNPADRILLASVADHLDRSERVLTDIMNVPAQSNISMEQRWAEDLLQTSRLYRQDALDANEASVAAILDDLERNLLEIVHSPSAITAADLEQLRRRIDAAALLFKVRVMSDELRRREQPPAGRALPHTSNRTIS